MNTKTITTNTNDSLNNELQHVTKSLVYYSFLIVSNLSFLTNILNIVICNRSKTRKKNTFGLYNTLMSSFNILSLIFSYLIYFPLSFGDGKDLLLKSSLNCILISYINQVCVQMCSWLNVTMSIDRTICIGFSHKFLFHKSKRNILFICWGLFLVICLVNIENFFSHITSKAFIDEKENTTVSYQYCISLNSEVSLMRDFVSQIMRTVLPVLLEFLLNAILIYKLLDSRRRNGNVSRSLNRDYKFAFLIVILNFLFLITQTPFMVVTIYTCVINYIHQGDAFFTSDTELIMNKYLSVITGVFATYMFGTIFFVNLFFNRIFQMELCNFVDETLNKMRLLKVKVVIKLKESMMKSNDFTLKSNTSNIVGISFKRTSDNFL